MLPNVDNENLEISFSVASAEPYRRFDEKKEIFYYERLSISEDAINFSRLNGGASILKNHDPDHTLGVVKVAWIEDGKVCVRAAFRKNDPDAVATFRDAADGRLPNVSIGYIPDTIVPVHENGLEFRDVTHWTPFEVSVAVGVPADATVGFYRSLTCNHNTSKGKAMADPDTNPAPKKEQENPCEKCEHKDCKLKMQQEAEHAEGEEEKQKEGEQPPAKPAKPAPEETKNPEDPEEKKDDERDEAETRSMKPRIVPTAHIRSLNIPKGNKTMPESKYSLVRAIQSLVRSKVDASYERDISDELSARSGIFMNDNSIMVSFRDLSASDRGLIYRNLSVKERRDLMFREGEFTGAEGVGAGMIGTDHRPDLFIETMKTRMGVKGATVLSGLVGNINIPTQTGDVTVGIGAMNSSSSKTKPTVGNTVLSPKKFSAYVDIGEDLIAQGNPDAVAFVFDGLNAQLARLVDLTIMNGNADPAIAGVDGTTGVQTMVIPNMASITWKNILAMYGKVADYEIEDGDLSWVTKGTTKADLMGISKDSGSGRFLVEDDKMNGFDVNVCGGLTSNDLYLGVWKNVIVGNWGGLELKIDDKSGMKNGTITVLARLYADIAITKPASFVKRVASAS